MARRACGVAGRKRPACRTPLLPQTRAPYPNRDMELPLESIEAPLSTFRPRTGTMEAWNAAYVRVEDYLRAHRIHNRLHQSRLIQAILERAARRHEAAPALNPTALAAEETEALMDGWFADMLDQRDQPRERIASAG